MDDLVFSDDYAVLLRLADEPEPLNFIQIDEVVQAIKCLPSQEKHSVSVQIEKDAHNPENRALLLSLLELFSETGSLTYTERLFSATDPEYAFACISWAKIPETKRRQVQAIFGNSKNERYPFYLTVASVLIFILLMIFMLTSI